MREIKIIVGPNDTAYAAPGVILGRAGEQTATRVLFDVSAWGEAGPYSVAGQNAAGAAWILEPTLTATNGVVTIDMPDAMVATAGMARLEIRAEAVGRRRKAAAIMLPVADALTTGAAPADAAPAWIDGLSQAAAALGGQIETGAELYADMEAARDRAEEYAGLAAGDRADAQEAATRASERADDAEGYAGDAAESAQIAANNILNGVTIHNANAGAHEDIRGDVQRVEAIARGRATAYVFDTYEDMEDWLEIHANVAGLVTGDNLYIRDTGVKDYWWDGEAAQELEAEAPDLTDYYTKAQVDALLPIYLSESEYAALVAAGTVQAGRVYYPVPDDQWEGS